jgi:hypothetical protein
MKLFHIQSVSEQEADESQWLSEEKGFDLRMSRLGPD